MKHAALLLTAALALGCGPQFDPSSELTTLRVLGLKKDQPYAQPGEAVNLQLLWHDAKGRDDVQTLFIDGCVNPPGDLYYGCFAQYGEAAAKGTLPRIGTGDTFQVTLPPDIISSRLGQFDPGQIPYGLDIVFFAVCAGRIELAMDAASGDGFTGVPVRCLDEEGNALGSEDFIVGYSSIYSFKGVANTNPAFTVNDSGAGQFLVAGEPVVADCVGEACQLAPDVEVDCATQPERCIKSCADDGDSECPDINVKPAIDPSVAERDDVSTELFGDETAEQMWISYYVDRGSVSEVRLLNDATTGWNEEYRGELRAPKDPGLLKLWAVSHDNRGGMDFSRVTLRVRDE